MASTRLLVEGPDIESLLERVRQEHGPGVRIVQADKLRSGGVGGFFAREKFAVTIEVGHVAAAPEAARTGAASTHPLVGSSAATGFTRVPAAASRAVDQPGTLLELADAIDAAEAAETNVTMGTTGMSAHAHPAASGAGAPTVPKVPAGLGPISTEGVNFAEVLAGLAQTTQAGGSSVVTAGQSDFFVPASIAKVATTPVAAGSLAAGTQQAVSATTTIGAPSTPAVPQAAPASTQTYTEFGRLRRPEVSQHAGTAPAAEAGNAPAAGATGGNPLVRRLLALGLPDELAQQLTGVGLSTLRENLVRVIGNRPLPRSTDLQAGDVLVIAGAGSAAYEVALDISRRLRLDTADILVAAASDLGLGIEPGMRISGAVDARRRSGGLRRADVPTVVAVDAPCDGSSAEWARDIADALAARVMWAVVDATTKPGDVLDHLGGLGRLDGLVVRGTAASRDPASVLQPAVELALPTVLLDGGSGDAEAWADLLIDRMGELP